MSSTETISPSPRESLRRLFGFEAFRPHQEDIVQAALDGRDTVGVLPTGAGKSLTFQLPALMRDGLTLVVSPLIALMEDQVHQLGTKGITAAACLTSRTSQGEWQQIREAILAGDIRLLYVAPERLPSPRFHAELANIPIRTLVVDEAHCVSEWGHSFRPDYRRIADARTSLGNPPVLALTATATPGVRDDIVRNLALRNAERIVGDFDRPNLHWQVFPANGRKKLGAIDSLLRADRGEGSSIVYAPSRAATETVAEYLSSRGHRAVFYHAGLSGDERERRQTAFQSGEVDVICATIAFGMGVHKDDVSHVIHYGMPRSLEAYYQEAGRAGRDGKPAKCTLLYSRSDLRLLHQRIEDAYPDRDVLRRVQVAAVRNELRSLSAEMSDATDQFALGLSALLETGYLTGNAMDGYVPGEGGDRGARAVRWLDRHRRAELNRLYAVRDYAETEGCRTRILVGYFGQELGECDHCDGCCGGSSPVESVQPISRKATKAVTMQPLSTEAQARFERLRAWRVELARQWEVPAFHIMNDKTMRIVADSVPTSREAFLAIPGLGEKKWEAFGRDLTAFFAE